MAIRLGFGVYVFSCALLFVACTSDSGGDGTGGIAATGGFPAAGGAIATGGVVATGGVPGAGGAPGTGGIPGTGGAPGTGGTPGTGGMLGTGGTPGTGGAPGTGGMGTGGMGTGGTPSTGPFALTSSAVMEGAMVPAKYRCTGPSVPLSWTAGPAGTMSYAIFFKDVSAGFSNGFVHWVIYDIPSTVTMLAEGVPSGYMPTTPAGAKQAPNYEPMAHYAGPCFPTPGTVNTYEFALYALDVATLPMLMMSSNGAAVQTQLDAHKVGMPVKLTIKSTAM